MNVIQLGPVSNLQMLDTLHEYLHLKDSKPDGQPNPQ